VFFKDHFNEIVLTEYGVIESLTAVFYFIGITRFFKLLRYFEGLPRLYFSLWFFLAIMFFLEETSYLQHYINYETPSYFLTYNAQKELNFHNITTAGGSLIDALNSESFDSSVLLKSQNLFNIGFAFYFLIFPILVSWIGSLKSIVISLSIPTVGIRFVVCVWIPISLAVLLGFSDPDNSTYLRAYMGEAREMLYSLAIMVFSFLHRSKTLLS